MPEIDIHASAWRMVEVGRVVLFTHGTYLGRLAVIVEIIDHKRVRQRSPPRHAFAQLIISLGTGRWSFQEREQRSSPPRSWP